MARKPKTLDIHQLQSRGYHPARQQGKPTLKKRPPKRVMTFSKPRKDPDDPNLTWIDVQLKAGKGDKWTGGKVMGSLWAQTDEPDLWHLGTTAQNFYGQLQAGPLAQMKKKIEQAYLKVYAQLPEDEEHIVHANEILEARSLVPDAKARKLYDRTRKAEKVNEEERMNLVQQKLPSGAQIQVDEIGDGDIELIVMPADRSGPKGKVSTVYLKVSDLEELGGVAGSALRTRRMNKRIARKSKKG